MIYTVTLNPALDRIIQISDLKPDDSNKIIREEKFAGGTATTMVEGTALCRIEDVTRLKSEIEVREL